MLVRKADLTVSTDDLPEASAAQQEDGLCLRWRWYRSAHARKGAVCSVHPTETATLQCVACLKAKVPLSKSYHCTSKCFVATWPEHKHWHVNPSATGVAHGPEDDEPGAYSLHLHRASSNVANLGNVSANEQWLMVGRHRTYTPCADDVGHVLKYEVVPHDTRAGQNLESPHTVAMAQRVIPLPAPPSRQLLPIDGTPSTSHPSNFTVMTYNVLADLYATAEMYHYCPPWALSWAYRKQALLREILHQHADIVCLQEVRTTVAPRLREDRNKGTQETQGTPSKGTETTDPSRSTREGSLDHPQSPKL